MLTGEPSAPPSKADYERIHDEVVAERGHPFGSIGGWGIRMEIGKRFEAFLRAHYRDEITIVTQIALDHLAITRQVTEKCGLTRVQVDRSYGRK